MWKLERFRVVFRAILSVRSTLQLIYCFGSRAAIRESADAQPASNGWPGLSISMTSGFSSSAASAALAHHAQEREGAARAVGRGELGRGGERAWAFGLYHPVL